jgi:Rho GTPase-activating protein 29/45
LEGVFRVAGTKTRMTELVATFNGGSPISYHRDESPAIVSSLLKQYFRDLPVPLLTFAFYLELVALASMLHQPTN